MDVHLFIPSRTHLAHLATWQLPTGGSDIRITREGDIAGISGKLSQRSFLGASAAAGFTETGPPDPRSFLDDIPVSKYVGDDCRPLYGMADSKPVWNNSKDGSRAADRETARSEMSDSSAHFAIGSIADTKPAAGTEGFAPFEVLSSIKVELVPVLDDALYDKAVAESFRPVSTPTRETTVPAGMIPYGCPPSDSEQSSTRRLPALLGMRLWHRCPWTHAVCSRPLSRSATWMEPDAYDVAPMMDVSPTRIVASTPSQRPLACTCPVERACVAQTATLRPESMPSPPFLIRNPSGRNLWIACGKPEMNPPMGKKSRFDTEIS